VLSSVVAAELLVGARRGTDRHRVPRLAFANMVIAALPPVPFDLPAARAYATIVGTLREAGLPIGDRDAMIAATALANRHSVLTLNKAEFERVPGLQVLSP
jgi:predicted nucleic acid-binding protein